MNLTEPTGPWRAATDFDARLTEGLGGPREADALIAALDRVEQYPGPILDLLDGFGLADHYVPAEYGGRLADHEELLQLWRTLARRDLSLVVAHCTTYLAAVPVWIAGTEEQTAELAAAVRGGARVTRALAESDRAAEPLHAEVAAEPTAGGYRLTGTVWPIGNATRGEIVTVLARTGGAGDPRGYSLLMVRKDQVAPERIEPLPRVRTHGIRGVELSGIRFDAAAVPGSALVGGEGTGAETVERALQLTRTVCTALSLGAGEHALRLAADFAAQRIIQDRPLIERPIVRAALARCAGLLAAAEAAAVLTARSVHSLTEELSVLSAVVGGLAPSLVDTAIGELAEVLGSRSFLSAEYADGAFQKLARDHKFLTILDGGTAAARAALIRQFPELVGGFMQGRGDRPGLALATRVGAASGPLDRSRLTLRSHRGCSAVQTLPALAAALDAQYGRAGGTASAEVAGLARELTRLADEVHARCVEVSPAHRPAAVAHDLAAAYELLYAGAAVLHLWRGGVGELGEEPLWRDALWARAALFELILRLRRGLGLPAPSRDERHEQAADELAVRLAYAVAAGAPLTPFGPDVKEVRP